MVEFGELLAWRLYGPGNEPRPRRAGETDQPFRLALEIGRARARQLGNPRGHIGDFGEIGLQCCVGAGHAFPPLLPAS